MPRSRGWSLLRASAIRSMVTSASIHSWHMPGTNDPSRITVGGTMRLPESGSVFVYWFGVQRGLHLFPPRRSSDVVVLNNHANQWIVLPSSSDVSLNRGYVLPA